LRPASRIRKMLERYPSLIGGDIHAAIA
jgi:hypothetical protein